MEPTSQKQNVTNWKRLGLQKMKQDSILKELNKNKITLSFP